MNWDRVEGKWKQMRGAARAKWGRLTDDDLDLIAGHRDQLIGRLQERYGIARDEAEKQTDDWAASTVEDCQGQARPGRGQAVAWSTRVGQRPGQRSCGSAVKQDMRQKEDTDARHSRGGHFATDWRLTVLALQPPLGLLPKRRTRACSCHSADSLAVRMVVRCFRHLDRNPI